MFSFYFGDNKRLSLKILFFSVLKSSVCPTIFCDKIVNLLLSFRNTVSTATSSLCPKSTDTITFPYFSSYLYNIKRKGQLKQADCET